MLSLARVPSRAGALTTQPGLLRYPYLQQLTTNSVIIIWTTAKGGASEVSYGIAGAPPSTTPATSDFFTEPAVPDQTSRSYYVHVAHLTGLQPGTAYTYSVRTNSTSLALNIPFKTDAGPGAAVSFAVLGDTGLGNSQQLGIRDAMRSRHFDLLLHTGDVAYPHASYTDLDNYFLGIYAEFMKSIPFYLAIGNHDFETLYGQPYRDVFYLPENATPPELREQYYSFDYGPVHFVSLDTEILAGYYGGPTATSSELAWLDQDLAATTQPWKIVFLHRPSYPSSNIPVYPNPEAVTPILQAHDVDMVFTGHDHLYARTFPMKDGAAALIGDGGIVYVTSGGGGGGKHLCEPRPYTATCIRQYHFLDVTVTNNCLLTFDIVTFGSQLVGNYSLDRCQADSDSDGLTDSSEQNTYHTNPLAVDTDGDTYPDKLEVDAGTDPNDPHSFPGTPSPTPTPAPTATPTPGGLTGDANCDGEVNSIDVALVLQAGAGLLSALSCGYAADVNRDTLVNSIDAALILQHVAGLLPTFLA